MIVTCPDCQALYDDAHRWTICPHRHLSESAHEPYPQRSMRRGMSWVVTILAAMTIIGMLGVVLAAVWSYA